MRWFRWYHGTVSDPKFASIAKRAGVDKPVVLATWAAIMESASSNERKRGTFTATDDEIAVQIDASLEAVVTVLEQFREKRMVKGNAIAAFQKRNPKGDDSAERVRRHRANRNASVTLQPVTVTPETRLDESRVDENRLDTTSNYEPSSRAHAREPGEIPAAEVDQVILAANSGLQTSLGENFNPIPLSHGSRQYVIDWLAAGVPAELAAAAVFEKASSYQPNTRHRQINTMKYFNQAVLEAFDRQLAGNAPKPKNGRRKGPRQYDYSNATNEFKGLKL